jgi:hypothetical protein
MGLAASLALPLLVGFVTRQALLLYPLRARRLPTHLSVVRATGASLRARVEPPHARPLLLMSLLRPLHELFDARPPPREIAVRREIGAVCREYSSRP